jgi:hypothetical protein
LTTAKLYVFMVDFYKTKLKLMWVRERENSLFPPLLTRLICLLMLLPAAGWSQLSLPPQNMGDVAVARDDGSEKKVPAILDEEALAVVQGIQYDSSFVGKKLRKKNQPLTFFGYYRLFTYGRNITTPYPGLEPFARAYGVGDGYREPMLSLNVVGRPNGKASFGTELSVFTPYLGTYTEGNVFEMNLGLNFYGNFRTKQGNFGVRAGGIHWYNLSPFTIGVFQILERFSIFDRTPWEAANNTDKYEAYYKTGATAPGDLRWNNQPFQGLIINGFKLPGDFSFDLFWGKGQPNGGLPGAINDPAASIPFTLDAGNVPNYAGFNGTSRVIPNFLTGGKIGRTFGKQRSSIYYNLLHSETALDSIKDVSRTYQVHTLSLDLKIAKLRLTGELGGGFFESPTYDKKWGEALMLRLYTPKEYTFLPLDIQLYQIGNDFFNQNGEIATNSNPEILEEFGLPAGANGVGGQLAVVNQLVHNRRGININTGIELGNLKLNAGWGVSQELEANSVLLSYVHRVNGLAMSRVYNPFPANATSPTIFGPYGRKASFFRGIQEVVRTTDLDPATAEAQNIKYFNAVDLQGKYRGKLLDRDFFIFYLGSFGTAKTDFSLLPNNDENSYLFVQYHEFDLYYEILPKFILAGYLGFENVRGGQFTEWDPESQLPLDQFATGYGLGFDWMVAENAGLYFRHRWMEFEDRSFSDDVFKGREITIELKTFF